MCYVNGTFSYCSKFVDQLMFTIGILFLFTDKETSSFTVAYTN